MASRRKPQPGNESLERFAARVVRAAEKVAAGPARETGTFHGDKIFIHAAWAIGNFDMTLAEFKRRLVEAHMKRLLTLSRADLVEAMDPYSVQRSEARHPYSESATYNFINIDKAW